MKRKCESNVYYEENTNKAAVSTFNNFYEENINWIDDCDNFIEVLRDFYPVYFNGDNPDYNKIKEDILVPYTKKPNNKAHEAFKSLFKIPYISTTTIKSDDLDNIVKEFGAGIIAHGVEEMKGGMYNLLLMCISNQVRVPSSFWGAFVSGMPNISPVGHGPYYLIYSTPFVNTSSSPRTNATFSDIAHILVPFKENKEILIDKLEAMIKVNLITPESKAMFINKLVTYQELICDLRVQPTIEKIPSTSKNNSFFKSIVPSTDNSLDENIGATYKITNV